MKKIITLLFALAALTAGAQILQSDGFAFKTKILREDLHKRQITLDPNRSTSNISIDYDSFDVQWQHQHTPPDSMYVYSWMINNNNSNDSIATLRYVVQTYDTLIDVDNNFAGTAKAGTTIRVDSFDIILAHENNSTLNDTLILSVFDKSAATVTGAGVNSKLNSTALWADTIIANHGFFPTSADFYALSFYPNVTLPIGHTFGIRVDFKGPITDQVYVAASFRDHCSNSGNSFADTNKIAPRNTACYLNLGANSGFVNYATNLAFNSPSCKWWIMQNLLAYPHLTLTTSTSPTVITNTATTVASTTATLNGSVNANGSSTTVTFDWGLTTAYGNSATGVPSPVTGSSATAVIANLSGLAPSTTYHYRVKGVNGGGTSNGSDLTFTTLAAGTVCTPDAGVTQGIGPSSVNTPCINQGVAYSQTFSFVIPSTIGGVATVNSVHFDSVGNLPTGLTAQFSQNPATYNGGASGCFLVSGTTSAPCGQYEMPIYVTITSTPGGTNSGELSALATTFNIPGYKMHFFRVIASGGTCPAVDSTQTTRYVAGSCGFSITATTTTVGVNCFGASTGSATVIPGGGSNYTYLWSNGGTNATISNLAAGTYTVTVSSSGSTATATAVVTQPTTALTVTGTVTNTSGGNSNGAINITAAGGTGSYTYTWSNSTSNEDLTGLAAGTYNVTVTDQNTCTASATYSVASSVGINTVDMVNSFNVFPNPASSSVNVQLSLTETANMKIELADLTGKVIQSESTGKVSHLNYVLNTSSVANGTYIIRVSGAKFNVVKQLTIAK